MAEGPGTQPSTSSSDQSSSQDSLNKQSQMEIFKFPIMYPALVPGLFPPHQDQEQINRGPGLYAVRERRSPETGEVGGEQGQPGEQPQEQQQAGPQRQVVVRRFQIAIQLDLLLILKLAAVIFLFNQDGSKQRLTLLVFFASLVYLYQTGALAPVVRWLSQGMRRAAAPPQPPRPAVRAANLPAAGGPGNENVGIADGQPVGENENQQADDGNRANENDNQAGEPGQAEVGNRWWGIAKEIQMIVFGFITSLLPGFHNID
ncbi:hypothetical protein DH2020_014825 [Rehmannia glutinosa]|uniref:Transmembrane protein n=1 Tax=Rehmannia glutinosa TaxID=99300 RepID=A0ABR0X1F6_REHGL